jgi:hypothetical protein
MNEKLADLLLTPESLNAAVHLELESHVGECAACRREMDELKATVALLDTWEAPDPNPYFLTRLQARVEEEREAAPAGWFERLRARLTYGSRITLRPVAAMSMTAALLLGGGAYAGIVRWEKPAPQPAQTAVVRDLETLDNNAQLLDQLETLSDQTDDQDGSSL